MIYNPIKKFIFAHKLKRNLKKNKFMIFDIYKNYPRYGFNFEPNNMQMQPLTFSLIIDWKKDLVYLSKVNKEQEYDSFWCTWTFDDLISLNINDNTVIDLQDFIDSYLLANKLVAC
jgi:hypothetical protein